MAMKMAWTNRRIGPQSDPLMDFMAHSKGAIHRLAYLDGSTHRIYIMPLRIDDPRDRTVFLCRCLPSSNYIPVTPDLGGRLRTPG
jgi:hypothetical protein